jgi:hypothetical protein
MAEGETTRQSEFCDKIAYKANSSVSQTKVVANRYCKGQEKSRNYAFKLPLERNASAVLASH